jgi:ACS family glucarate transporter-like MFS transporter
MIAPIATGYVVAATGSYDWAFGIAGLLLLAGAIAVLTMTRSPMTIRSNSAGAGATV